MKNYSIQTFPRRDFLRLAGLGLAGTVLALVRTAAADRIPSVIKSAVQAQAALWVGLRRSSYGGGKHAEQDAWWASQARAYAANFSNAAPTVIEIISVFQDNGGTQFEFQKPSGYRGPVKHMSFASEGIEHEQALNIFDLQGVKAIIQMEPGSADMLHCLEIANLAFGRHPCVVGFGVDAEWYHSKEVPDGRPITDAEARQWMEAVLAFSPNYTLFLKHWEVKNMPPTYRHPNLWFLSDSQEFKSQADWLADFKNWADHFKDSTTGYQFGYPKDRRWWSKLKSPPMEMGQAVLRVIPSARYLFWVDFTADKVKFTDAVAVRPAAYPASRNLNSR